LTEAALPNQVGIGMGVPGGAPGGGPPPFLPESVPPGDTCTALPIPLPWLPS